MGGLHILCVRESRVSLMARWCSSLFEVHMECSLQGVASPLKGEHMISNVGLQSTCTFTTLKLFCKERVKPSGLPCLLLPSVCGCRTQCWDFQAAVKLAGPDVSLERGVFACSGPEWLSQDRWTEKGKYQRQSWNKPVTCEGFHGYDKGQQLFWEKGPDEKVTPGEVSVPVSINRVEQFLLLPYRKT